MLCFLQAESQEEEPTPVNKGDQGDSGQGKAIQQKQPDLSTVAEDDSEPDNAPSDAPMQRAPSPSASHASTEDDSSPKKKDAASSVHASAFGARAQRSFSDQSSDLGHSSSKGLEGKPSSSSGYSGLNPTSTRSASRMLSDNPPPASTNPSGPVTRRDLVANSILQLDIDNELDTFTADIDCLVNSSDEEEQQQQRAKGKKESSEGGEARSKGDSESSAEARSSLHKEGRGDEEVDKDDDEGDVSCRCSP